MTDQQVLDLDPYDEPYWGFVCMSATGPGTYYVLKPEDDPDDFDDIVWSHELMRRCVADTIPAAVMRQLDNAGEWDERFPEDQEVKWTGWLTRRAWDEFREWMYLDPETDDETCGILGMGVEWGDFSNGWAFSNDCSGMDWNVGGYTPVSYVNTYYCARDEDILARAREVYGVEE